MTNETVCDRESLLMWAEGILIDFQCGKGRVCHEQDARRAEAALLRGETVLLTVDGEVVTRMVPKDGKWVEELLEKKS